MTLNIALVTLVHLNDSDRMRYLSGQLLVDESCGSKKKKQHLALLPTLNGVSLLSVCCLKLIYVQFEKDIRPFLSGALLQPD